MPRLRALQILMIISAMALGGVGCSDEDTPSSPPENEFISQSYSPIDTVSCPFGGEVIVFDCSGVRVYGDMLLSDLELVSSTVSDQLAGGEVVRSVLDFREMPGGCVRGDHPVGDVTVNTCDEYQGDDCLGGRYFNFELVEGALELSQVAEWDDD